MAGTILAPRMQPLGHAHLRAVISSELDEPQSQLSFFWPRDQIHFSVSVRSCLGRAESTAPQSNAPRMTRIPPRKSIREKEKEMVEGGVVDKRFGSVRPPRVRAGDYSQSTLTPAKSMCAPVRISNFARFTNRASQRSNEAGAQPVRSAVYIGRIDEQDVCR